MRPVKLGILYPSPSVFFSNHFVPSLPFPIGLLRHKYLQVKGPKPDSLDRRRTPAQRLLQPHTSSQLGQVSRRLDAAANYTDTLASWHYLALALHRAATQPHAVCARTSAGPHQSGACITCRRAFPAKRKDHVTGYKWKTAAGNKALPVPQWYTTRHTSSSWPLSLPCLSESIFQLPTAAGGPRFDSHDFLAFQCPHSDIALSNRDSRLHLAIHIYTYASPSLGRDSPTPKAL